MGGIFSSMNGSVKSITEIFAFPYKTANKYHIPIKLKEYEGINYGIVNENIFNNGKIIIFCHGNCMTVDRATMKSMKSFSDNIKVPIYMVEYKGYGESADKGYPTAENCVKSLSKMVDYISKSYADKDIYLMGHSIGTGVVAQYVYQNRKRKFGGMILLAPYKSILSVVITNEYVEYTSSSLNFYETRNIIADITIPKLIIHGVLDDVIDVKHSDDLVARDRSIILYKLSDIDHNNIIYSKKCIYLVKLFMTDH
jgi:pimeloyl-ACP methyl ester carboxylesterase